MVWAFCGLFWLFVLGVPIQGKPYWVFVIPGALVGLCSRAYPRGAARFTEHFVQAVVEVLALAVLGGIGLVATEAVLQAGLSSVGEGWVGAAEILIGIGAFVAVPLRIRSIGKAEELARNDAT